MKSRTKWLIFITALWFSCLFFLLYLASICDAQDSEIQKAKLIDCQSISFDETILPKRAGMNRWKRESLICFWRIIINDLGSFPIPLIMWREPGTENYGFIR